MADVGTGLASSGAPAGQPGNQGGGSAPQQQQPAPAVERGRIGDFGGWSGRTETTPAPRTLTQEVIRQGEPDGQQQFNHDDFAPLETDVQSLAIDDSQQAEVMTDDDFTKLRTEYEAWKNADDLPEPFLQKFGTVTIDGQRYRIPASEAFQGYQRNSDYSLKLRQVYALKAQVEAQARGFQAMLADLDVGQTFLQAMVAIGKFKGFHEAAVLYGKQLNAEQQMPPEARAIVGQNRALSAQLQQTSMRLRQLEQALQQTQQQQPAPDAQYVFNQLAQMWPRAAQSVGWVDSPAARREFEGHWDNMYPSLEGGEVSTQFVAAVMRAAMETLHAQVVAANRQGLQPLAAASVQSRPQLPPGRGLPGPAPSSQNGNGIRKRERISDLASMVTRR